MTVLLRRLTLSFGVAFVAALTASRVQGQEPSSVPSGATARCRDGTYSFSKHRSGTCSHHGGVATWLTPDAANTPLPSNAPSCGGACGIERWQVKTLSDPDRQRVQLQKAVSTTVEALVVLQRPATLTPDGRADPVEVTVYSVEA